jgi:hypothetical protein
MIDIIGDIHGCFDELIELLIKLGYEENNHGLYVHPEGRKFASVGDLIDRGPKSIETVLFFKKHVEADAAYLVEGNHDNKFARYLNGNPVKISKDLAVVIEELNALNLSPEDLECLVQFMLNLPAYLEFDEGQLTICHAAPPDHCLTEKKNIQRCLYGITNGRDDQGLPIRLDWTSEYEASVNTSFVVYGHVMQQGTPYRTEKTICIDTGACRGMTLTAFRWPEREIVQVKSNFDAGDYMRSTIRE